MQTQLHVAIDVGSQQHRVALGWGEGRPIEEFDGPYLLNVSANNIPLTQLNGNTHGHTPVYLSAGLNVITVTHGSLSTDCYVRNGGTGTCTLP